MKLKTLLLASIAVSALSCRTLSGSAIKVASSGASEKMFPSLVIRGEIVARTCGEFEQPAVSDACRLEIKVDGGKPLPQIIAFSDDGPGPNNDGLRDEKFRFVELELLRSNQEDPVGQYLVMKVIAKSFAPLPAVSPREPCRPLQGSHSVEVESEGERTKLVDAWQKLRLQAYIGAGYKSKMLCTGVFVDNRPVERVNDEDLVNIDSRLDSMDFTVDYVRSCISTEILPLFPIVRVARFRQGHGCALVDFGKRESNPNARQDNGTLVEENRRSESFAGLTPPPVTAPGPVDNSDALVDRSALDQGLNAVITREDFNSRNVLVMYKGRIVGEAYAPGYNAESKMLSWSIAKSVTSAMVGLLVADGKLSLEQDNLLPEWQNDPKRSKIKLKDLLHMSAGLRFTENYDDQQTDVNLMLFRAGDQSLFAASMPLINKPGSVWSYATGSTMILQRIMRHQFPTDEAYLRYPYERLFYKIGMSSALIETDASGKFASGSYSHATTRDWAKFGLLYLNRGKWHNEQILPESWIDFTATPAPAAPNGKYGAQFWLNRGSKADGSDRRWPDLPRDMLVCDGHEAQRIMIFPSNDLVIVRFERSRPDSAFTDNEIGKRILATLK